MSGAEILALLSLVGANVAGVWVIAWRLSRLEFRLTQLEKNSGFFETAL